MSQGDPLDVAYVRGPHGVAGEVRLEVQSDVPGRIRRGARLLCDGVGELVVASVRGAGKTPVVAFQGYADREGAATLTGRSLRVTREEARRAASGGYLWADLVGLSARSVGGTALGSVVELIRAGGADVLVIRPDRGADLLVPMLESTVKAIDLDAGTVVVAPQEELPA